MFQAIKRTWSPVGEHLTLLSVCACTDLFMCMWLACSSSWAVVYAITMRDFLVQTLSIKDSADYSPTFLESNSEELSLTCWWSPVWLLYSESQNIIDVMQKPFKSSVAALCCVNVIPVPHHECLQILPLSLPLLLWHGTKGFQLSFILSSPQTHAQDIR